MNKMIQVQNVSRGDFHLNLDFVKEGKYFDLKPNSKVHLTTEELDYLSTQCIGVFSGGYLKVVDSTIEDAPVSSNVMSKEEIQGMMDLTIAKFKTQISKITSLHLLKDIRQEADHVGKTDKFLKVIDDQIEKIADGVKLL